MMSIISAHGETSLPVYNTIIIPRTGFVKSLGVVSLVQSITGY